MCVDGWARHGEHQIRDVGGTDRDRPRRASPSVGPARCCSAYPRTAPEYTDEWQSFVKVLDAHAAEEERDLCPPPIELSADTLEALGDEMLERISQLRDSAIEKLHVRGRAAILRGF